MNFAKNFKNTSRRLPLIFRKLDTQTFNSKKEGQDISISRVFRVQVFLGPDFSVSRFSRVWVKGPGPGFRGSHYSSICC